MAPLAAALSLCTLALPAGPDDWTERLWPLDSVELSAEPRLFALLAALNACGLDEGPVARALPVPRVAYGPLRQVVRARVLTQEPSLRAALQGYLDAHPRALESYLAAVLAPPGDLEGLEALLERAWTGWRLEELRAQAADEQRRELVAWVPLVEGPLQRARALLKTPDRPVRLISCLLDVPGEIRRTHDGEGRLVLVLGRVEAGSGEALAQALARVELEPLVAKHIGGWTRGPMVLRESRMDGAQERSPTELAVSLLSQVVAGRATGRDEGGALGALLEQSRSLEAWVQAALPRLAWRGSGIH
jgi:hypothetical protein